MGIQIALAGNPNCGKTTMFNEFTGASQYVGNWPGVTVEKKQGKYTRDKDVIIIDLPGVYSLSPYSPEEIVARDYLMSGEPDVVINLIDATNLERNLYLTTQILDLGIPVVVALNMMDLIHKRGDKIDVAHLANQLGCPVVETSALRGEGLEKVVAAAKEIARGKAPSFSKLRFDESIESAFSNIARIIEPCVEPQLLRWFSLKLFEGEETTLSNLELCETEAESITQIRKRIEDEFDDDAESIIASERYDVITALVEAAYKPSAKGISATQKIDRVVTSRWLGLPIFILIMTLVYYLAVSTVGTLATDWANEGVFGEGWLYTNGAAYEEALGEWQAYQDDPQEYAQVPEEPDPEEFGLFIPGVPVILDGWLESIGTANWLRSLIVDGIFAGVGAILGFIPQMIVLFLLLSLLEGCGYMARVAFVMDRVFRKFGLSGKSFIPMLIASGCGVPAVMATKTIENEKDRRMTIMTTTMIPCGAKLPIIALVFGALAGGDASSTWWIASLFYFLGLAAIILSGIMLKKLRVFAGEATPFVMELPQYHVPAFKNVVRHTWERVRSFIVKAGTIIFISSIVIWFLLNFGIYEGRFGMLDPEVDNYIAHSLLAMIGQGLAWLFAPLGFGSWEAAVATVTGLVAKENVVSTMAIVFSLGDVGEGSLSMWNAFGLMLGNSAPAILAFCAFNLLCAPCFAAIGTIRNQMASTKWTWAAIGYMTAFAWAVALVVYQFAGLFSGELSFNFWTLIAMTALGGMLFQLFRPLPHYEEKELSNG